jgi:hypothetical protein
LHLLHCGVLRRPTPLRAIIRRSAYHVLRTDSGSFAIFAAIRRASSLLSSFAAESPPPRSHNRCTRSPARCHLSQHNRLSVPQRTKARGIDGQAFDFRLATEWIELKGPRSLGGSRNERGVCTENLNPDIMVMKSAENRV